MYTISMREDNESVDCCNNVSNIIVGGFQQSAGTYYNKPNNFF
jgi:hypothetical protein